MKLKTIAQELAVAALPDEPGGVKDPRAVFHARMARVMASADDPDVTDSEWLELRAQAQAAYRRWKHPEAEEKAP